MLLCSIEGVSEAGVSGVGDAGLVVWPVAGSVVGPVVVSVVGLASAAGTVKLKLVSSPRVETVPV